MAYEEFNRIHKALSPAQKRAANRKAREILTDVLATEARKGANSAVTFGAFVRSARVLGGNLDVILRMEGGGTRLYGRSRPDD